MLTAFKAYGIVGIAVFFAGHILADFSWYVLISFLVSRTRKLINERAYKIVVVILAMALIGFGINFILSAAVSLFA